MSIDKDKIKHVSKLASISVDENKIDDLTKDLSSIFVLNLSILIILYLFILNAILHTYLPIITNVNR